MSRRPPSWLPVLATCLMLAGCEDVPLGPELPRPTVRPSVRPATTTPQGSAPAPTPLPGAGADRQDDENGFRVKVFYVLPADVAGEEDADAIPGSVAAWNGWFEDQTGGHALRLDTRGGALDVTFFRSRETAATLRAQGLKVIDTIDREVREAGHNHPMKLHAYYFGGPIDMPAEAGTHTLGVGGSGRAMVFMRQFEPAVVARRLQGVGPLEWTMAHEIVHALGFVGECAPHKAQDAHVLDDEADLMTPTTRPGIFPVLDRNRDDYFGHGKAGCLDLAKTVYFHPLPPGAEPPPDAPAALAPGAGATPARPAWRPEDYESREAVESRVLAHMNAARAAAGLPAWAIHPGLSAMARRRVHQYADAGLNAPDLALDEQRRLAGYPGSMRGGGVSLTMGGSGSDADALAAIEAAMDAGLGETFRKLAADAANGEAGVGAWIEGQTLYLAYMAGQTEFDVSGVTISEGPFDTYTLTGRARVKGAGAAPEVRVSVDGQLYRVGVLAPGQDWFDFAASVPRKGTHSITLMTRQEGDRFAGPVELFEIDGARPLAEAVLMAPAPVE